MKTTLISATVLALLAGGAAADDTFTGGAIHMGVVTKDLEASVAFYTEVIGMTRTGGFEVDAPFARASGLTRGVPFSVTILKLKDSPDASQFKLMSFERDPETPKSKHIEDALGIQYITLMVTDLTPVIARLEKAGVPFLGETPVPLGDTGNHFALVQGPDGTFIELIGPAK
jgi:catechol 2,3-dioxygenase-like lactoylglutathione lyase family enzyme